jgi:hypothetical protein
MEQLSWVVKFVLLSLVVNLNVFVVNDMLYILPVFWRLAPRLRRLTKHAVVKKIEIRWIYELTCQICAPIYSSVMCCRQRRLIYSSVPRLNSSVLINTLGHVHRSYAHRYIYLLIVKFMDLNRRMNNRFCSETTISWASRVQFYFSSRRWLLPFSNWLIISTGQPNLTLYMPQSTHPDAALKFLNCCSWRHGSVTLAHLHSSI